MPVDKFTIGTFAATLFVCTLGITGAPTVSVAAPIASETIPAMLMTHTVEPRNVQEDDETAWDVQMANSTDFLDALYDEAVSDYNAQRTIEIGHNPCVHISR